MVPPARALNDSHASSIVVFNEGLPAVIQASELSGGASTNGVLAAPPLATTAYGSLAQMDPARLPEWARASICRTPPTNPVAQEYVWSMTAREL